MDLRIGQRWALQSTNECAMREGQKRKHSMRQELDGAHVSITLITETRQSTSTTSTYKELNNLEQQLNMGIHNIAQCWDVSTLLLLQTGVLAAYATSQQLCGGNHYALS